MEAGAVEPFCRIGEIAFDFLLVLPEEGRPREAIPQGVAEVRFQDPLGPGRYGTVAFIYDEGEA